mgnify:CR=1 FL=1|jgi:hypothetical protein
MNKPTMTYYDEKNPPSLDSFIKEVSAEKLSTFRFLYIAFHPELMEKLVTEAFEEYVFLYGVNRVPLIRGWN